MEVSRITVFGKNQTRKEKLIRKLVVPSNEIWGEITRRYYFSETGDNAPSCPPPLCGKKFMISVPLRGQSTLVSSSSESPGTQPEIEVATPGEEIGGCVLHTSVTCVTSVKSSYDVEQNVTLVTDVTDHTHTRCRKCS